MVIDKYALPQHLAIGEYGYTTTVFTDPYIHIRIFKRTDTELVEYLYKVKFRTKHEKAKAVDVLMDYFTQVVPLKQILDYLDFLCL